MNSQNTTLELFDIQDLSQKEQEEFLMDIGDLIMKSVLKKAWMLLDADETEELTVLLEESQNNPEDAKKIEAVFEYLNRHINNLEEMIRSELEELNKSYKQTRDELLEQSD